MSFSSSQWKAAKEQLKADTGGKCAYCEAPTDAVAHGDVEHFRPKSIYWWLAFCFDNYLFSCQICNQTYKSDNFPVGGNRLQSPVMPAALPAGTDLEGLLDLLTLDPGALTENDLIDLWGEEAADLPNPYLDNPEDLFVYELDPLNKEVWIRSGGGDRADRALAAVEGYLGLNREALRRDRYVQLAPLMALRDVLAVPGLPQEAAQIARTEANRMRQPSDPYAGMTRFFADAWCV